MSEKPKLTLIKGGKSWEPKSNVVPLPSPKKRRVEYVAVVPMHGPVPPVMEQFRGKRLKVTLEEL